MPRNDARRVTQRQQIDSSQSANVPLPVQASLSGITQSGAAMFALGRALSGMGDQMGQQAQQNARVLAEKNTKDSKAAGAAKAAEKNVTGVEPTDWLYSANQIERESYQETDGINAVGRFEQSIQPELARLEPGANIDEFIQQHAEKFLEDNPPPEKTRQTFLAGLSKSQENLKSAYLKQSLAESLKRNEESTSALLVSGLQNGSALNPDGYAKWRAYAEGKGMHDDEIDAMAVNAVKASLQSGDVDTEKALALLKTASGPGRPVLADVPAYKQDLQLAAQAGERVRKDRQEKAQAEEFTHVLYSLNDAADKGVLSDHRIDAMRNKYGQTPEWAAQFHNRNREARDRLAAKALKAGTERTADVSWWHHDALAENAAGLKPDDVGKAGDRAFTSALQSNDEAKIQSVLEHSARTGAPIPALKGILSGSIDENDPQRSTRYVQLYERMQNISPEWAAHQVDDKTLARITQYQTAKMLGANDQQAWSQVKMGSNLDTETVNKNVTEAMKLVAKEAPKDFDDGGWFHSDTPISNTTEMDTAYRLSVKAMVQAGASPEVAAKAALTRVQTSFIRVGDRMVRSYGTGDGLNEQTSAAMTEASNLWKDKLVASNVVGKDDPVWFTPVPGSPNKWRLKYFAAGGVPLDVTHEVTVKGPDGVERKEQQFIDVIPSAARANYTAWKKQEEDKKVRNAQTLGQLGQVDTQLTPDNVKALNERFGKLLAAPKPDFSQGNDNAAALADHVRQWDLSVAHAKKVSEYINNPANQQQSFAEFITSQH